MYKNKNKFTNVLGLVVKHLVKCLEDTTVDAAKTVDLHAIFDIFTEEFSQLKLPVQQHNRLEYLVDNLISNDMVQEPLLLTTAPYPACYTVPFLELQMRVHHNLRNVEGELITIIDFLLLLLLKFVFIL